MLLSDVLLCLQPCGRGYASGCNTLTFSYISFLIRPPRCEHSVSIIRALDLFRLLTKVSPSLPYHVSSMSCEAGSFPSADTIRAVERSRIGEEPEDEYVLLLVSNPACSRFYTVLPNPAILPRVSPPSTQPLIVYSIEIAPFVSSISMTSTQSCFAAINSAVSPSPFLAFTSDPFFNKQWATWG